MPFDLPESWQPVLKETLESAAMQRLAQFLAQERRRETVYPPEEDLFNALKLTPPEAVRVLLLGQDPYHHENQAHGLCFSVPPGVKPPPSLANIFRELQSDLGCRIPDNGCLVPWARQGVLLLNTVLTVRAHRPNSHRGRGWEEFTDAVIRAVNAKTDPVVFVLWGAQAQKKARLIDAARHPIVQMAHPSPLSAYHGFFGSRPFSRINAALREAGKPEIDWQIPDVQAEPPAMTARQTGVHSMRITLYEKPTCSKCREAVALLQARGIDLERIDYYVQPLDRETLTRLLGKMGARPQEILRTGETVYRELGLDQREVSDEELIGLLAQYPDLVQRPILETEDRAVLGRPVERIAAFLETLTPG